MVSLGEAISLQGRNNIAEQIGKMTFQATEAQKARALKAGVEAGESAKDQQKSILELFKQKGDYHRLILPKAQDLATRTFQEMAKIKASGTPYATNQFAQLHLNTYKEFEQLKTESEQLKAFDEQLKTTDYGKKFFGYGFSRFLPAYQNAKSLEDLRKLREQDPAVGRTLNFVLDDRGIPSVVPRDAIQYERDLKERVSGLQPLIVKRSTTALDRAYGAKAVTTTGIVPFTDAEVLEIQQANPELASRNILSVESVVDAYLAENPSLVEQIADQANIPYTPVPGSPLPDDATVDKVRDYLMKAAAPYAKTRQVSQVVYPPGSRGGTGSSTELTDDDLVSAGSPQTFKYGEASSTYTSVKQVQFEGGKAKRELPADAKITIAGTTDAPGGATPNAELNSMVVLPYKTFNGVKRPVKDGSSNDGYHVFLLFTTPQKSLYADADAFTAANVVPWSSGDIKTIKRQMDILKRIAANTK